MPEVVSSDAAAARAAPASPLKSPFVIGGGGFAIGLFTTFGVGALFQSSKYAFALTAFGFVAFVVLVMAVATTSLSVIVRSNGKTIPIGALALCTAALLTFGLGTAGAVIFYHDFWENPRVPASAFYSGTIGKVADGRQIAPWLMINGKRTLLSNDPDKPLGVEVQRDAELEVRIVGVDEIALDNGKLKKKAKQQDATFTAYLMNGQIPQP